MNLEILADPPAGSEPISWGRLAADLAARPGSLADSPLRLQAGVSITWDASDRLRGPDVVLQAFQDSETLWALIRSEGRGVLVKESQIVLVHPDPVVIAICEALEDAEQSTDRKRRGALIGYLKLLFTGTP